ncbi:MAG: transposase [Nitrospirota bacterium]|nr:transposase [Nitrospirota bacterium]
MKYNREKHHRRSLRLKGYDYANPGAYYVTICSWQRMHLFGEIIEGEMLTSERGEIVHGCWTDITKHFNDIELDEFILMPNHIHGIIIINGERRGFACNTPAGNGNYFSEISPKQYTLSVIIRSFKSAVAKSINALRNTPGVPVWQRNYYEHIIRDEKDLMLIREYIRNNPLNWKNDGENTENMQEGHTC